MKTKLVVALLASSLSCISTLAQLSPAPSSTGSITVNASTCATTNACVVLHMASSNVGYSVTVSGTWTGTLTVEQSGDNQGSWTSATTTTANTLFTSALTPGITDVRVRGSAAMTGAAVITITASGPATLQQITQTGGSSSSSSPGFAPGILASNYSSFSQKYNWATSFSNGSAVVTAPAGTFSALNVSNIAFATNLSKDGFTNFVSAARSCGSASGASGTIASFQSDVQVTLSANCVQSYAAFNPFVWGPDETVGVTSAITAAANACATLIWPALGAIVTSNPFINPPTTNCVNNNAATRGGVTVMGQGQNIAALVIPPNFDMATCNKGGASNACAGATGSASFGGYNFDHFLMTGYGANPVSAALHYLVELNAGSYAETFTCTGIGAANANIKGLHLGGVGPIVLHNVQFDGCGSTPLTVDTAGGGNAQIYGSYFGDGSSVAVALNGELMSNDNIYGGAVGATAVNGAAMHLGAASSLLHSVNDKFANFGGGTTSTTLSIDGPGAVAYIDNGQITSGGTNATSLFLGTSTSVVHLHGTTIGAGSGTGNGINTAAGSSLYDDCGNSFPATNAISGNVFGSCSITGVAQTAGNIVATSGWGTNTVTVDDGGDSHSNTFHVAITGGVPAASPVLTITHPKAFLKAWRCTLSQIGGTFAVLTNPVYSSVTATGFATTFAGTPVSGQTYNFEVNCP